MDNSSRIILDLCGGTGSWSNPYKKVGYDVRNITLPKYNILDYILDCQPWGILAAPPCTQFSHARTIAKEPRDVKEGLEIVNACRRIIWEAQYDVKTGEKKTPLKFWALENPGHGILKHYLGKPALIFNPYDFGDNYKKVTYLWGWFNEPKKFPIIPTTPKFDQLKTKEISPEHYGQLTRTERRAITPPGFAKAFFEANP
jgi:hypothetical protein